MLFVLLLVEPFFVFLVFFVAFFAGGLVVVVDCVWVLLVVLLAWDHAGAVNVNASAAAQTIVISLFTFLLLCRNAVWLAFVTPCSDATQWPCYVDEKCKG